MNSDLRNSLTEYTTNYRLISPYILDCYAGLTPPSLTKISIILFSFLLNTKRYCKPESRMFSKEEDSRIYTNIAIKPGELLKRFNPTKMYNSEEIETDTGNLMRKVNELDDLNIFYIWRCGYPYVYMFVMERDIGLWKNYNSLGCVTPKTLKKIISLYGGMLKSMDLMLRSQNQVQDLKEISDSFGKFLNHLIEKMNADVSKKLKLWDSSSYKELSEYISYLYEALRSLDPYEGLSEDSEFLLKLPYHVGEKLQIKPRQKKVFNNSLANEIVSNGENIIQIKNKVEKIEKVEKKQKNDVLINPESVKAEEIVHNVLNPFKNCNDFMKFYKKILLMNDSSIKFFEMSAADSERKLAQEILDMLIKRNRSGNVEFLKAWVQYYQRNYLKAEDASNVYKTSLKAFRDTFEKYDGIYAD